MPMAVFAALTQWVKGRGPGAPGLPPGFVPELPAFDDDVVQIDGVLFVGASFAIVYCNSKREWSRRRITVRRLEAHAGDVRIGAHCHERNAYRMFLASRISELIDLSTGEVFEDPVTMFERAVGPLASARALQECAHALNALAYVGLADGHFHKLEILVAVDYVAAACADLDFDVDEVQHWISALHPDPEAFEDAVDWLVDAPASTQKRFLRHVKRLVEADGVLDPAEVDLIMEIDDALGSS